FGVVDSSHFKYAIEPKAGDVAGMVIAGFQQPLIAFSYILAQIFLGLHLWHGGSSWLQHLGLNGRGYGTLVDNLGAAMALLVAARNCSTPLVILMGWTPGS